MYIQTKISVENNNEILHYLQDDLGSPVRLIDNHGNQRDVFNCDEFGNALCPNSSNQSFGFTGYQHDSISGTLFAQARQYKPEVGRFVSEDPHWNPNNMIYGDINTYSEVPDSLRGLAPDPLAIVQSSNLYTYTINNPVNNVDLNGEALITVSAAAIWGGVKLVGGAFAAGAIVGGGANVLEQSLDNDRDSIDWREVRISSISSGTQSALVASGWKRPIIVVTNMVIAGGEHLLTNDEVTLGLASDVAWAGGFSLLGTRKPKGSLKTTTGGNGVPDGFVRETLRDGTQQVLPNTFWRELGGAFKDDAIKFSVENAPKFWNWLRDVSCFGKTECDLND